MTERKWSAEEGGAEPMSTKVEQWQLIAGNECYDLYEKFDSDEISTISAEQFSEIIAARCPYSSSAVEELVRAATAAHKRMTEDGYHDDSVIELGEALAALEKEKQHGR